MRGIDSDERALDVDAPRARSSCPLPTSYPPPHRLSISTQSSTTEDTVPALDLSLARPVLSAGFPSPSASLLTATSRPLLVHQRRWLKIDRMASAGAATANGCATTSLS